MDFKITCVKDRKIIVSGIGRLFYQDGIPIGIAVQECWDRGYEVSLFHVADELLKEGWTSERVWLKLQEELHDSGLNSYIDKIREFIFSTYEKQRAMIFEFLFEDTEQAKEWFWQNFRHP